MDIMMMIVEMSLLIRQKHFLWAHMAPDKQCRKTTLTRSAPIGRITEGESEGVKTSRGVKEQRKTGSGRARRQGEDRSRSWAIVTSIDPISCCLFAHSPLCIKGAVRATGRPRALHLITWHADRCYGLIRTGGPLPFASTITSAQRGRGGEAAGREGQREGGEEIKYLMMACWSDGGKWNGWKWSVDGGGRRWKKGRWRGHTHLSCVKW